MQSMWLSQSLLVLLWCHFLSSCPRVQSWLFSTMMHDATPEFTSQSQAACHSCVFVSSQCRTAFAEAMFLFNSAMVSISNETASLNIKTFICVVFDDKGQISILNQRFPNRLCYVKVNLIYSMHTDFLLTINTPEALVQPFSDFINSHVFLQEYLM